MKFVLLATLYLCVHLGSSKKVGTLERTIPSTDVIAFVETELNSASNDHYYVRVTKVLKAKKQVVQGVLHRISFLLSPTICKRRAKTPKLSLCPIDRSSVTKLCKAEIWVRAWLNPPMNLQAHSCVDIRNNQ